jgi:hypothetical protein
VVEQVALVQGDPVAQVLDPVELLRGRRRTMPCTS